MTSVARGEYARSVLAAEEGRQALLAGVCAASGNGDPEQANEGESDQGDDDKHSGYCAFIVPEPKEDCEVSY